MLDSTRPVALLRFAGGAQMTIKRTEAPVVPESPPSTEPLGENIATIPLLGGSEILVKRPPTKTEDTTSEGLTVVQNGALEYRGRRIPPYDTGLTVEFHVAEVSLRDSEEPNAVAIVHSLRSEAGKAGLSPHKAAVEVRLEKEGVPTLDIKV